MLGYLISPIAQIQDIDGKPISGAQLYVYLADTTNAAPTFSDFEGHRNTFPAVADLLGNCTIIADSANTYDLEIRNPDGTLLMGKKNLSVSSAGSDGGQTFSPGFGIGFSTVGNTTEINVDTDLIATQEDLNDKQDKLTAGVDLKIDENNVVSIDTDGTVVGTGNFIAGKGTSINGDYNIVAGLNNAANGSSNSASGAGNSIESGARNHVSGLRNNVKGYSNTVSGTDNTVDSSSSSCSGLNNTVSGTGNVVGGYNNTVSGNNSLVVGEGLVSANQDNSVVGKFNTGVNALFAVGCGTDADNRKDALRVDPDGSIYYTYNGNMVRLIPAGSLSQYHADVPNDGTTVVVKSITASSDSFDIEGVYDTTDHVYKINIRNRNTVSRGFTVYDSSNNSIIIGAAAGATSTIYSGNGSTQFKFNIYGMGVGYNIPMGEYILYFLQYQTRLVVHIYEVHPYGY